MFEGIRGIFATRYAALRIFTIEIAGRVQNYSLWIDMQTRYSYPLTNELLSPEIQPWFASPIARETDRQSCDSIGFFVNLLPASTQLSSQPITLASMKTTTFFQSRLLKGKVRPFLSSNSCTDCLTLRQCSCTICIDNSLTEKG